MVPGGSRLLGRRGSLTAVGLVAVLVYANTLLGDFTFDDNFAVVCIMQCIACPTNTCGSPELPAHRVGESANRLPAKSANGLQINNGDVTNPASPIRDLFKHDFW